MVSASSVAPTDESGRQMAATGATGATLSCSVTRSCATPHLVLRCATLLLAAVAALAISDCACVCARAFSRSPDLKLGKNRCA